MDSSLLFISDALHDTCVARVNGDLPTFPATLNNPFLTPQSGEQEPSLVEAEVLEKGILLASDAPINYAEFIDYLKEIGIEVEQLGVNICG